MENLSANVRLLRAVKIALVLAVCGWGVAGALGNLIDWEGTKGSVKAVSSMVRFEGGAQDWRATTSSLVVTSGAVFIVAFKSICALLCAAGAAAMWRNRSHSGQGKDSAFAVSKTLAIAGCLVAVFGLFFGWIVVGEGWFEFWRDAGLNGLEGAGFAAFRYGGFIALIAVLIAQDE